MSNTIHMTAPPDVYKNRRANLAAKLSRPLVVFAGVAPPRNYVANYYPPRPGSTYTYFGGPPLQGAALLIEPASNGDAGCTLLRIPEGPDDALWEGAHPSDTELATAAGLSVAQVRDVDALPTVLNQRDAAFISPPCYATLPQAAKLGLRAANDDEMRAVIDLRLIKDSHEIAAMREAARVGVAAHKAAMAATKPGRREADVAAAFYAVLVANQCRPSFNPIVTVRGETLHLIVYPNKLEAGSLMLVDGGAEEPGCYASDITRTYPVSGKWSDIQRHLYATVLRAMRQAIAACTPGTRYRDVHDLAARVTCEGLVAADLLRGAPADLAARLAHTLFFPHGVGHLLGLDVHDMEDFGDLAGYAPGRTRRPEFGNKFLRMDRDLAPGMTFTIEPGIYLVPAIWRRDDLTSPFKDVINRPKVESLLKDRFGGIRIEENVLVTPTGPEVLTAALPSDADAVLALVGSQ